MPELDLAIQGWTVRNEVELNAERTLRYLSKTLGFRQIELAGCGREHPEKFAVLCKKYELEVIGIHQPSLTSGDIDELVAEFEERARVFDTTSVTVMLEPGYQSSQTGYVEYAKLCEYAGAKLSESGIELAYHCYTFDLNRLPNQKQSGLDILLANTDEHHLAIELDTHFVCKSGQSFSEVAAKCGARLRFVHINDCAEDGKSAPLGKGKIVWSKVRDTIDAHRDTINGLILEHNTREPFKWLRKSLDYWQAGR